MSEVRRFLLDLGREMGRTEQQMEPMIAKLEDQWYDTLDSLRAVTDWSALGLPQRLVDTMKERLGVGSAGAAVVVTGTSPASSSRGPMQAGGPAQPGKGISPPRAAAQQQQPPPSKANASSWDLAPEEIAFQGVDVEAVAARLMSLASGEELSTCVMTLVKLLDAVLKSPQDESKRSINLGNENFHKRVGRFPAAVEFLEGVGFRRDPSGSKIVMEKAYISRLTDARQILAQVSSRNGLQIQLPPIPMNFNPFVSSVSTTAGSSAGGPQGRAAEKRTQEAAQLQEELSRKRQQLEAMDKPDNSVDDSVPRFLLGPPKLCWTQDLGSLKDAIRDSALDFVGEDENDEDIVRDLVRGMQGTGAGQFKAREKSELAEFQRKKVYQVVLIRVLFPNKMILEIKCKPNETVRALYAKVGSVLQLQPDTDFYLYDTPPIRKLTVQSRKTLAAEGLAPGSNLHLGLHPTSQRLQDYQRDFLKKRELPTVGAKRPMQASHQTVAQAPLPMDAKFYLKGEWFSKLPPEPLLDASLGASSSSSHWTPTASHATSVDRRAQNMAAVAARTGAANGAPGSGSSSGNTLLPMDTS
ncbi:unnamed protein product [Amoebophrya sp. A120]|nr:unnamed protein product [Amoebophrya sp. A120]|eukprot:GSA120T00021439001.1